MRLHLHSDPNWQVEGAHRFYECRCGARRVMLAYANVDGPVQRGGWPELRDKHGQCINDSRWQRPA